MRIAPSILRRSLRIGGAALAAAVIIGYAVWRSAAYVNGPAIEVYQPVDGSTVASTTAVVAGRADRVASLSMNGAPISMDQNGDFKATVILFQGVNFITLSATDRFGRTTNKQVEVLGSETLSTGTSSRP